MSLIRVRLFISKMKIPSTNFVDISLILKHTQLPLKRNRTKQQQIPGVAQLLWAVGHLMSMTIVSLFDHFGKEMEGFETIFPHLFSKKYCYKHASH